MGKLRAEVGSLAALAAVPVAVGGPPSIATGNVAAPDHCVVEAVSFDDLAIGAQPEWRCYPTVAELLRGAGLARVGETSIDTAEAGRRLLGAGYLAYHYKDANGAGGSIAVQGSCDGSGIPALAGEWNDAISSTRHQACGRIKHFADANAGGDHQITQAAFGGVANMTGSLNDRVTSIYYYET